jgi:multidrug efflux pump subunit AcrA (membrane-fusion protein)
MSEPTPPLYRRRALEGVSSSEQLDRAVRVIAPHTWVWLAALLLVVAVAIVWSAVSTVPTTVNGPAFLIPLGGLREAEAPITGTVETLHLQMGEHVVAGQELGMVRSANGDRAPILAPATGTVTETDVPARGYVTAGSRIGLIEPAGWPLVVYAYLPMDDAGDVRVGTPARVRFAAGIADRYGFAEGHVQSVGQYPASSERLRFTLQDAGVIRTVDELGPANEIVVALDQSARTPSGLVWGSGDGPPAPLPSGLPGDVEFITGSHHPIENALG